VGAGIRSIVAATYNECPAAAEQKQKTRGDRHASRGIPYDAVTPMRRRMQRATRRDYLVESARLREARVVEKITANGEGFNRAVDRHAELLSSPLAAGPKAIVEVVGLDPGYGELVADGTDQTSAREFANPGKVDRDHIIF
jgi:hypothetical protein